jgi:DNA repair protein RecO (recombination protein O)
MLVKTRGIVLNYIKFRETSIIVRIYTEQLGLQSYIINSIRKKAPGSRMALFQPFTLLDLVVYPSARGGISRISEYKCHYPFASIPFDIRKSSVLLFLSEVVSRTIREEEENPALFGFLHRSMLLFDQMETGFENFHLVFLLQLSTYLGFAPSTGEEITTQVAFATDAHAAPASRPALLHFQLFEPLLEDLLHRPDETVIANGKVRRELLHILIRYYQLHVDKFGEIKSLSVLSEVLAEN